jgi:SAM-dependent methyltransferase
MNEFTLADGVHQLAKRVTDREWLELLIESIHAPVIRGVHMPRFPEDRIQRDMVGSTDEPALREAFLFWQEAKAYFNRLSSRRLNECDVLDFGCGWGRYTRLFLKDTPPDRIAGVDVEPEFVALSAQLLSGVKFSVVTALPPTDLPANHFDLIYAYSVFSHLSENAHQAWIHEFARVVKAGGLVVVTTHSRSFIDFCASLREKLTYESEWHSHLARCFIDAESAKRDYAEGRFLYAPTGGGGLRDCSFYGEAVVSPLYVQRAWTGDFEVYDFVDDARRCPQAIIVARRK